MNKNNIYEDSITKWGNAGGIGTLSYDKSLDLFVPVKEILNKYFAYSSTNKATVVVINNSRRDEWAGNLITGFNYIEELGNRLKFLTADDIIFNKITYSTDLVVFDQIDRFYKDEKLEIVKGKYITGKFKLGVTNSPDPDQDTFGIYEYCPVIHRVTKLDVITNGLATNVVEYNIPIKLDENDLMLYKEYNTFISDTIDMFGSFDMALKCYMGDTKLGISADHFRNELATSKGWSSDIDTSSKYYSNIDRYFSPNALYERAKSFTEIIRKRKNLLHNNKAKINTVLDIVAKYKDKKILIINKSSILAHDIAMFINERISNDTLKYDKPNTTLFTPVDNDKKKGFTMRTNLCVEYHPDVESRPLIDIDTNDYIRYKSGVKAGTVKMFGSTSLNKMANDRFNKGYHNVMSSTNAIPKTAELEIDFIIITSPECETLNTFQYRVHRLDFKHNVKIVNLYLENTSEYRKLKAKQALNKNEVTTITNIENELNL